jgi:hypothetical protein
MLLLEIEVDAAGGGCAPQGVAQNIATLLISNDGDLDPKATAGSALLGDGWMLRRIVRARQLTIGEIADDRYWPIAVRAMKDGVAFEIRPAKG